MKETCIKVRDQVVAKRYLIGFVVFVVLVFFKVSGSSIGMWDTIITDQGEPVQSQKVILSPPRSIRSDEWTVQTMFSFSQVHSGYKLVNDTLSEGGQNMIVAYNSPMRNIFLLSKPFNWGYAFLGTERGLSWSWCFKLIGLVLLSFELGYILTKRNKNFALLTSVLIPLSPAIQWWFVSPVGDLIFFMLGMIVAVYYYFYCFDSRPIKWLCCVIGSICLMGYVFVLYPALQVPLGYLTLLFFVYFFFEFRDKVKLKREDFFLIGGSLLFSAIVIGLGIFVSKDAISAVLHTAYPGARSYNAGQGSITSLFYYLTNWLTPYRELSIVGEGVNLNCSEISSFFGFLPVTLILCPMIFHKEKKGNLLPKLIYGFLIANLVLLYLPFPQILLKITMLSYITIERLYLTVGFSSLLLLIWSMWRLTESKKSYVKLGALFAGFTFVLHFVMIHQSKFGMYFSKKSLIITVVGFSLLIFLLFLKQKRWFFMAMTIFAIISGGYVNPINIGTGAIYNKKVVQAAEKIEAAAPGQYWLSDQISPIQNLLPALGINSLNSVVFYPNLEAWKPLDPDGSSKKVYNRYARIYVTMNAEPQSHFELLAPDAFVIRYSIHDLEKYNIKYILSENNFMEDLSTDDVQFHREYGPDADSLSIYAVTYPE